MLFIYLLMLWKFLNNSFATLIWEINLMEFEFSKGGFLNYRHGFRELQRRRISTKLKAIYQKLRTLHSYYRRNYFFLLVTRVRRNGRSIFIFRCYLNPIPLLSCCLIFIFHLAFICHFRFCGHTKNNNNNPFLLISSVYIYIYIQIMHLESKLC